MFECSSRLTIGVGDIIPMQPFVEQINLAVNFRRELNHRGYMAFFHGQYQVGFAQHGRRQLMRAMHRAVDAAFSKQLQGSRIHGAADKRAESGAAELDVARFHTLSKQVFGRRAAADVAHADNQYPFEHSVDILLKPEPASIRAQEIVGSANLSISGEGSYREVGEPATDSKSRNSR